MNPEIMIPDNWLPPVYLISGDPGEGKTSYLLKILGELAKDNLRIKGFAAPGYFRDDIRSGFSLLDLATGELKELCSIDHNPNSQRYGRFFFRSEGLSFGRKILSGADASGDIDLLVIDEVGKFELNGEVWSQSLDHITGITHPPMIWTARRTLVNAIVCRWMIQRPIIIDIHRINHQKCIDELREEIRIYHMRRNREKGILSSEISIH